MGEIEFLKRQRYSIEITLVIDGEPDESQEEQWDLYEVEKSITAPGHVAQVFSWLIYLIEKVENDADAQRIANIFKFIDQSVDDWTVNHDEGEQK